MSPAHRDFNEAMLVPHARLEIGETRLDFAARGSAPERHHLVALTRGTGDRETCAWCGDVDAVGCGNLREEEARYTGADCRGANFRPHAAGADVHVLNCAHAQRMRDAGSEPNPALLTHEVHPSFDGYLIALQGGIVEQAIGGAGDFGAKAVKGRRVSLEIHCGRCESPTVAELHRSLRADSDVTVRVSETRSERHRAQRKRTFAGGHDRAG